MSEKLIGKGTDKKGEPVEFYRDEKRKHLIVRRPQTDEDKKKNRAGEKLTHTDERADSWKTLEDAGYKKDEEKEKASA